MQDVSVVDMNIDDFYDQLDKLYEEGDVAAVRQFLEKCAREISEYDKHNNKAVAIYNELGSLYRSMSYYSKSVESFEKAGSEVLRKMGKNSSEYATLINNLAGTYRLRHDYDRAEELFTEAIDIYQKIGDKYSYAFASVHNNIALLYQETGQFKKAAEHLQAALNLMESFHDDAYKHEIAVTYSNLTALYHKIGDDDKARKCLDKALSIFESLDDKENVHYAAALNSLAGFLYAQGDYHKAIETYHKAADYTRYFFGENVEYGIAYQSMYWSYLKLGNLNSARECLEEAYRVYRNLFGPDNEKTRMVEDELSRLKTEKTG